MKTKAQWVVPYSKQVQLTTAGLCTLHPTMLDSGSVLARPPELESGE